MSTLMRRTALVVALWVGATLLVSCRESPAPTTDNPEGVVVLRDEVGIGGWWGYNPLDTGWPETHEPGDTIVRCWASTPEEVAEIAEQGDAFSAQPGGGGAYCTYTTV